MDKKLLTIILIISLNFTFTLCFAQQSSNNHSPVISSINAAPPIVKINELCTITADVTDPDGDVITYSWSSNGRKEGSLLPPDEATVFWNTPNIPGTYTISLTASDSKGQTATKSIDITVVNEGTPNLALKSEGSITTASSFMTISSETGTSYEATPDQVNDGITYKEGINKINNTFWAVDEKNIPAWLQITFPEVKTISKIIVKQLSFQITYCIEISIDGEKWINIVPEKSYEGPRLHVFTFYPIKAQHIKLTVTKSGEPEGSLFGAAIWEVEVYEK